MSGSVAVFVPVIGQVSETFLRRHVEELAPGGTVVVARRVASPAAWTVSVPTLLLDPLAEEWGGAAEQEAVRGFLAAYDVQAALTEYLDVWVPFVSCLRGCGVRQVAHAHGYDVSMRLRDDYWSDAYQSYADAAAVATPSTHSRTRLLATGLPPSLVHVVPCGVDLPDPAPTGRDLATTQVLIAARLVAKKSPVTTLEACVRAHQHGAELAVSVIGDGPLRTACEDKVRGTGLPVTFFGAQPHDVVLAMMRRTDIFCQHSVTDPDSGDEEGLPVAILEAMAHAMAVVSTRHAGIVDAVQDGVSGLLVDERDGAAMSEHLVALSARPELRRSLGQAARARVADQFTWIAERHRLLRLLDVDG
jgi:glycosyltransferase involved in cell wall biosynthesis